MEAKPSRDSPVPPGQPRGTNGGTARTNDWSARKTLIISSIASFVVAAAVSWITVQMTLKNEIEEGWAVFNNIGLRYFDALLRAYDKKTGKPSKNSEDWEAYRKTLVDLQEDIRWLRTNPLYSRIQKNTQDLVFVQNRLAAEIVRKDQSAGPSTLYFMCRVFVESGEWKTPRDNVTKAILDFANANCSSVLQSETTMGQE